MKTSAISRLYKRSSRLAVAEIKHRIIINEYKEALNSFAVKKELTATAVQTALVTMRIELQHTVAAHECNKRKLHRVIYRSLM